MDNYKNNNINKNIVKDKYTYTKLENKNTDYTYIEVPKPYRIDDGRKLEDFKVQVFGGYQKTKVLSTLDKCIIDEKIEEAVYWAFQLLLSGYVNAVWDKLYSIACKNINIQNPSLPDFLYNRYLKWDNIVSNQHFEKEKVLLLRNHPEIRNLLVEMVTILTISRKRKIENLPKVKKNDFVVQIFQSKLEAPDSNIISSVLKENDPSEVRIAVNEMAFHIKKKNMTKALYWLCWLVEWDKMNVKRYNKFEVDDRHVKGVSYKYSKNLVWLIWDVINYLRKHNHLMDFSNEYTIDSNIDFNINKQIDALWNMYIHNFTQGQRCRKLHLIIWAIKYMTTNVDWRIKMVEREYLLFQSISNINVLVKTMKSQEVRKNTYQNQKFDIVVRNNYLMTQKHNEIYEQQKKIQTEKDKQQREKEAKKKKISTNSLAKLNALRSIDTMLKY